jgi:hypothetical protein
MWSLDACLSLETFARVQEQLNRLDIDDLDEVIERELVLLRVVDPPWPFPLHYPLAPLDPLDYPDRVARRIGREVLSSLAETKLVVLARRSARARALSRPLVGKLLELKDGRAARPRVQGDPKTDTRAAAVHIVRLLCVSASHGLTVKELRAAIGQSREWLEDAYEYPLEHPPLTAETGRSQRTRGRSSPVACTGWSRPTTSLVTWSITSTGSLQTAGKTLDWPRGYGHATTCLKFVSCPSTLPHCPDRCQDCRR